MNMMLQENQETPNSFALPDTPGYLTPDKKTYVTQSMTIDSQMSGLTEMEYNNNKDDDDDFTEASSQRLI